MALSASVLGGLIDANLATAGAIGSKRTVFANAVADGIVLSIVGKTFVTSDVGSGLGGTGTGTGIIGLIPANMTSLALATMTSQGTNAAPLMNAIMMATTQHLSTAASLASVDPFVAVGVGTITVGSIAVVQVEMTANILAQLTTAGAIGTNLANLCLAISTGITTNIISTGTGTLVITGIPGLPSAGAGTGVIS